MLGRLHLCLRVLGRLSSLQFPFPPPLFPTTRITPTSPTNHTTPFPAYKQPSSATLLLLHQSNNLRAGREGERSFCTNRAAVDATADISAFFYSARIRCRKRDAESLSEALMCFGANCISMDELSDTGDHDEENPAYAKCRDKPFPPYKDLEFLTQKTTATGRYGFSSAMEAPQNVDSSSSSSPGENEDTVPPLYENIRPGNTSRSPSPANVGSNFGASGSGSGHSSARKRPRSPRRPASQYRHAPSTGGRRQKDESPFNTFARMVDIGRQNLDLVRQMYQVEITKRGNIASIEDCMARVYSLHCITPERILAAAEALKDDKNRQVFITMTDDLAIMWLDRQVAKEQLTFRQFFPGV